MTTVEFQNQTVNHSHPIVVEWGKAYDSIIKFKEGLTDTLSEHQAKVPHFPSLVEELKNMELHSLDRYNYTIEFVLQSSQSLSTLTSNPEVI